MNAKIKLLTVLFTCFIAGFAAAGDIVPGLDDATAEFDGTTPLNNANAIVANTTYKTTFAVVCTPSADDISNSYSGSVVVLENGGTGNGSGIYITNGMYVFYAKDDGSGNAYPSGMYDTDLSDNSISLPIGAAVADTEQTVYFSYDAPAGQGYGAVDGQAVSYSVTGFDGEIDLSGSQTVTFLGTHEGGIAGGPGNLGAMTGNTEAPNIYHVDSIRTFTDPEIGNIRAQIFYDVNFDVLPNDPSPANGEIDVDPDAVTQLQFDAAEDPANPGSVNPNITGHFVTVYSSYSPDPNQASTVDYETFVPAGSDPVTVPYTFQLGDDIYWQVEEQISGASKGDSSNILGPVWGFEALPAIPVIDSAPADAAGFAGETLSMTCEFTSKSPANVFWVKAGDPEIILDESDPDITISGSQHGDSYVSTLEVANIEIADQGEYVCRVTNADGSVDTASAKLGVKRTIGYWPLDGDYTDASGEGHDADPNVVPQPEQWVDGVDPAKTGQALDTVPEPYAAAATEAFAPAAYTNEMTISLWVKWSGDESPGGFWSGLVSSNGDNGNNWFFELSANGQLHANAPGYDAWGNIEADNLTPGEWAHVALVNEAGEVGKMYINGALVAVDETYQVSKAENPVYLMCEGMLADGTLDRPTVGVFDEIKMYNYALTGEEIAAEYYDITGETVCADPYSPDLQFDINGDCEVTLADFAMFAADWGECNLLPSSACDF
ncbi:LamG-like jellyroll fold domain-containing protein [Sedimentisphaera salicampi]|uniref:LamG-like jellyroll fold domain-containing protein n=1 Tax=Sedimentisphaera salicampi TaxID=1941349 RepID=UPI000B9BE834|nr:LamG-like jellyroll fold domain-containing protein [Sedimentisphaera salicampi]OXU13962.1 Immunoglobulin I-set domain protein [Sedimentisphaera salicampi]